MEIDVIVWNKHKIWWLNPVNWTPISILILGFPTAIQIYTNNKTGTQTLSYSKIVSTITKMNDNINKDSELIGSVNICSFLNSR